MRQDPVGHGRVIPRKIELGQPCAGIKDAVGMGQPYSLEHQTAVAGSLRFDICLVPDNFLGPSRELFWLCLSFRHPRSQFGVVNPLPSVLIFAQTLERGLTHNVVRSPGGKFDLAYEARLNPMHALARDTLGQSYCRFLACERIEL